MANRKKNDLLERTFNFGVNTIIMLRDLPYNEELRHLKNQLIRSSTSVGANYEEAQAASSKADFISKVKISLRESRESNFWLRTIRALGYNCNAMDKMLKESVELKNILAAIIISSNNK